MARRPSQPRTQGDDPPGWGDVPWRVMMHLLKHRPTFGSARELARRTKLGHSQVAEVVSFLLFHRALRETEAGLTVEWDTLAKVMAAFRLPAISPRSLSAIMDQRDLHHRLQAGDVRHVFGFTTSANALAYFEPHPETCVLVGRGDVGRVLRLVEGSMTSLPPRGTSPGPAPPRVLVFADKLERLDTVESKIGVITSLHQTYVDLLHFPLAAAHADVLHKAIERRWAREQGEEREP